MSSRNKKHSKPPYFSEKEARKIADTLILGEKFYREGMELVEAFAKAAKINGLNKDELHLVVRGWNVGSFHDLFSSTKDLEARTSDIPVLDFDEVYAYYKQADSGMKEHKKAAIYSVPLIDDDLPLPPDKVIPKLKRVPLPRTEIEREQKLKTAKYKLENLLHQCKELDEELNIKIGYTKAKLEDTLNLARKGMEASEYSLDAIFDNLSLVNPSAALYAKKLANQLQQEQKIPPLYNAKVSYEPNKSPYKELLEAAQLKQELKNLSMCKTATRLIRESLQAFVKTAIFGLKKKHSANLLVSLLTDKDLNYDKYVRETQKEFDQLRDKLKELREEWMEGRKEFVKEIEELQGKVKDKIDKLLDNSAAQAERFMVDALNFVGRARASDELLANYEAEKVFNAYTTLKDFAPLAMQNDTLAISYIKKFLEQEGRLDPFDLRQLAEIERFLAQSRRLRKET